jgi:hypothetical protein
MSGTEESIDLPVAYAVESIAIDLADWVYEHQYLIPACYPAFDALIEKYRAANHDAGRELPETVGRGI